MTNQDSNPQNDGQVASTTIAEELRAAFAAAETETKPEPVKEIKAPVEKEVPEPEDTEEEPSEESAEEETPEQVAEKEFPLIPNNWSEDEKQAFQTLLDSDNEDMRAAAEIFIERHNSMKKTFFKKTEELANVKKELKPIVDVFAPFEQHMKNNGVDKQTYITNMITWEMSLQKDPVNTVKKIMQTFNVRPEQIAPRDDFDLDDGLTDSHESAKVTKLEQELNLLRTQIANQPVLAQVRQFEEATDAQGKLLHPHFAEVKPIMGQLIQQGKAATLQDAYKKAIKVLDLQEEQATDEPDNAVDLDKIRQKLVKAKKASKGVTTKGSKTDFTSMSIKDELRARLNS
jgi:hypothetical protein